MLAKYVQFALRVAFSKPESFLHLGHSVIKGGQEMSFLFLFLHIIQIKYIVVKCFIVRVLSIDCFNFKNTKTRVILIVLYISGMF